MLVPLSLFAAGCGGGGSSSAPKVDEAMKQKNMGAMKGKMQGGDTMSKQDKGAGVPDKTPTPGK
jgi:hypothetical protein